MIPQPLAVVWPVEVEPHELPLLSVSTLCVERASTPIAAPTRCTVSLDQLAPMPTPIGKTVADAVPMTPCSSSFR